MDSKQLIKTGLTDCEMIQKFLKKIHILQYLHKFFLVYKEYICMYFVFINFGKIKKYLNKQKESFLTIRNYVAKSKEGHFRKIVFVIDGKLQEIGGVETRLLKTLKYLKAHNFHPIIIASGNNYEYLSKYPFIKLSFDNILALKFFVKIIKKIHPEYIEFQVKGACAKILAYIGKKQIKELQTITKTGILFHSKQYFLLEKQIKYFNNILSVGTDWLKKFKNIQYKIYKIPNYIQPQKNSWMYLGQTKVLFISRLHEQEKMQHMYNLISLCKGYNFNIDIAGTGEEIFIKKAKKFAKKNNVAVNFIGKINTIEYLNNNLTEILFVAGVGQVIFESASFNIPSLVITHNKKANYSDFVTKDNIQKITAYNCVLNTLKLPEENFKNFVADIPNNLDKYMVKEYVEKNYSTEKIMSIYMNACKL